MVLFPFKDSRQKTNSENSAYSDSKRSGRQALYASRICSTIRPSITLKGSPANGSWFIFRATVLVASIRKTSIRFSLPATVCGTLASIIIPLHTAFRSPSNVTVRSSDREIMMCFARCWCMAGCLYSVSKKMWSGIVQIYPDLPRLRTAGLRLQRGRGQRSYRICGCSIFQPHF